VFLDNIRKVIQADGYASGYEDWASNPDVDIRIHHSLGLDEGHYVRRTDTLNVESSEDVEFLLQDEDDVVEGLLDEYSERVSYRNGADSTDSAAEDGDGDGDAGEMADRSSNDQPSSE
jgi:hypothetical protein